MIRMLLRGLGTASLLVVWATAQTAPAMDVISQLEAERWNMRRAWFVQANLDRDRASVQNVLIAEGRVYLLTDRSVLQAIDMDSGRTAWSLMVGEPGRLTLGPAVNGKLAAVIVGCRLYLIDQGSGRIVREHEVPGAPGWGPALSDRYVFVPLLNGKMYAFALLAQSAAKEPEAPAGAAGASSTSPAAGAPSETRAESSTVAATARVHLSHQYQPPLAVQAEGRSLLRPLVVPLTPEVTYCIWTTQAAKDRIGYLNFGILERQVRDSFFVKYRMVSPLGFEAPPTYVLPNLKAIGDRGLVIAAGLDGFVRAVNLEGQVVWQFSTGTAVKHAPVVIDDRVFVCSGNEGMYCLEARTGKELWWAADIVKFLAAGKTSIYAVDRWNYLLALDPQSGQRRATLLHGDFSHSPANDRSDRLILVSAKGLVQCLHEADLTDPVAYNIPPAPGERPATQQEGFAPGAEQPAAERPTTPRAEAPEDGQGGNRPRQQEPADPFQ